MKKILLMLLCAFFMLSGLVACSGSDAKENENNQAALNKNLIIGKWEANVDMTDRMEEIFASDESMGEFIDISDFKMKFFFTFNENSMMKLEVDEVTLSESFDTFFVGMKQSMYEYFETALKESELGLTVEEFLEKSNMDLDEFVKNMSNSAMQAMRFDEMSFDCYYEMRYNRLYSYDTVGQRNDDEYIEIEFIDENTLQFVSVKTEDKGNILTMIKELKRVNE